MAGYIQSPFWMLAAWGFGALYAISGAIVYGVLAARYPFSGGDYQYLSRSIHPAGGYLFGWSAFFVTYSGSIAALSIAGAYYLNGLFPAYSFDQNIVSATIGGWPVNFSYLKLVAILLIAVFTWINYRGIVLSGTSQIILTVGIFLLLVGFSLLGTVSTAADVNNLQIDNGVKDGVSGFLTALIAVLFAYIGWTTAVYVAEEIGEARRILPKALLIGVLVVAFIYQWVNLVYMLAIPLSEMTDIVNIGSKAAVRLWGENGQFLISGLILVAVLSSLNSTVLSGPRIYMAMGRDGFLAGKPQKLHPRFGAPYVAIIWQAIWSIILVISGSFNELLSFVVFVVILFSMAAGWISLKLTIRHNPLKILPLTGSLFYLLFCFIILINTLMQKPAEALIGLFIVALAIPFYLLERKRHRMA